jgi:hypothetical protein
MTKVFSALRFVNVEYANEGENNTSPPARSMAARGHII